MYKVLLVDDEQIILDGINKVINWESYDCEVCAIAHNAADGMDIIKKFHPEIIITDICMQPISGLEMIEQSIDDVRDSQIAIITAHRDFEYAKKSISLGVCDFILKPIDIDELNNVIQKMKSRLDEEKARKEEIKRLINESKYETEINREIQNDLLFLFDNIDMQNKVTNFQGIKFVILTFNFRTEDVGKEHFQEAIFIYINKYLHDTSKAFFITPTIDSEMGIVIFDSDANNFTIDYVMNFVNQFVNGFNQDFQSELYAGISSFGEDTNGIINKYLESRQSLLYNLQHKEDGMSVYNDLPSVVPFFEKISTTECFEIVDVILSADREKFENKYQVIKNIICGQSDHIAKKLIIDIVLSLYQLNEKISGKYEFENDECISDIINQTDDIEECMSLLYEMAISMIKKVHEFDNISKNSKLNKVIDYVNENYAQNITRNDIAKFANVTPNYVSTMFRSALGMTYVEYLNNVRIKIAKKMLAETSKKLFDIANEIGYRDVYYFSKVFKQMVHLTPGEYRTKNQLK